jgi:hypothetical protein
MVLKQSETVTIKRSEIKFAPYNPRKQNKKVVEALKKNFKKVGFLGGIQWNSLSGNLIGGHKRLEALDLVFSYDRSIEKDYDVKVEKIELDDKTEKEQNIFLNNKRVQGETDFKLMAELIKEIDIEAAGIEEYDINLIESLVPDFKFGNNEEIKSDLKELKESADQIREKKKKQKNSFGDTQLQTHFTITFETYDEKAEYLESIGISGDQIFITSKRFFKNLNDQ